MKRQLALSLALCMSLSMFAGCGNKAASGAAGEVPEDTGLYTESGYPVLVDGTDMTITAFAPLRPAVTDYNSPVNKTTTWLEEKTGVKFSFQTSLEVDAKQKVNTIMVSGEFPDVLMFSGNYPMTLSEQQLYGMQGSLVPLNDLIENYMPNLKKMLDENPQIREAFTMQDGNIYAMPQIGKATHSYTPQRMWINQTWLDNLGLPMPTTTEAFYETLKAFKEQDANGNGDPNDEIPLTGSLSGWNTDPNVFLMNAFGMYNRTDDNVVGLSIDKDGNVVYPKVTEEWKEGLGYLNKLYSEGLLDNLTYSQTNKDLVKLGSTPGEAIIGACAGGSVASFLSVGESDRWQEYVTVPPLEGPNGFQQAVASPDYGKSGLCITSACDPSKYEAIARVFDINYTEEGVLRNRMGVLDETYQKAEDGDVNFVGDPAKYIRLVNNSEMGDNAWVNMGPWGIPSDHDLWYKASPNVEKLLYNEAVNNYYPYAAPKEQIIPALVLDEEQSRAVIDVEVPMEQYVAGATADFVMGKNDLDAGWDKYVKDIESFGLSKYLETYQTVYDAKMAK